jgi:hypothetical protein
MGFYPCLRMFDSLLCLYFFIVVFCYFETISALLKLFWYILLCFPGPSETVRGSNFYDS